MQPSRSGLDGIRLSMAVRPAAVLIVSIRSLSTKRCHSGGTAIRSFVPAGTARLISRARRTWASSVSADDGPEPAGTGVAAGNRLAAMAAATRPSSHAWPRSSSGGGAGESRASSSRILAWSSSMDLSTPAVARPSPSSQSRVAREFSSLRYSSPSAGSTTGTARRCCMGGWGFRARGVHRRRATPLAQSNPPRLRCFQVAAV